MRTALGDAAIPISKPFASRRWNSMTDRPLHLQLLGNGFGSQLMSATGSSARTAAALIGDEPPIAPDAESTINLHAVNWRWLVGTVLAGIGGVALVGASLLIALDGQANFASKARLAIIKDTNDAGGGETPDHVGKGDRIVSLSEMIGAKQVARIPDTIRVGDREIIKARMFTRVTTAISLSPPSAADEIPRFNPLQIVAAAANVQHGAEDQVADADADVSMVKRSLSGDDSLAYFQGGASDKDASEQVTASVAPQPQSPSPALALPSAMLSRGITSPNLDPAAASYAPSGLGPFSAIDVRVVPENVVVVPKSDDRRGKSNGTERVIAVGRGESFEQLLATNGATPAQIAQIQAVLAPGQRSYTVTTGQKLRLLVASAPAHKGDQLLRVVVYGDNQISAIAAVDDSGDFHAVMPPAAPRKSNTVAREDDEDENNSNPTLYEGLYETALKNGVPRSAIDELVRIFAYDVDFQRKAQPGDSFDVLYVKDDENTDSDRVDILYATLTTGDEVRKFYRYQTQDDGVIDYFDEAGKSAKKFLLRKPLMGGRFSSPFGYRFHPVLGYGRAHTGVDWADKVGTPIFAAGNGVVLKASWDAGGYGNRVELQHTNGYVTTYNHMSAYAKGIAPGVHVRQGQVIGFIGSTGLATGPHLHYEVIVNGHFVDPLRIKLPRGRELEGKALADFNRERQHDDDILARMSDPARIAQSTSN